MITRVRVKNFRSLADIDVTLGPLTALVGRNGAGKSAFIDVMRFVRDALTLGLEKAVDERGGFSALRRWMPDEQEQFSEIEIKLNVEGAVVVGTYTFRFAETKESAYKVTYEHCQYGDESFERRGNTWVLHGFNKNKNQEMRDLLDTKSLVLPAVKLFGQQTLQVFYQALTENKFYTFAPDELRRPQKRNGGEALKEQGENLAACILHLEDAAWFNSFKRSFQLVTDITNIRVEKIGVYLNIKTEHTAPSGTTAWFDLAQESDGSVRLLAVLVSLYQDVTDTTIVLEEPELFLHPGALNVISGVIKETALNNQVIIATQSPDLISEFDVHDLRVVEKTHNISQIGELLAHQKQAVQNHLFTTGDLLRIEGLRTTPFEAVSADNA